MIKVDKSRGGQRKWIKKLLSMNIINFTKVDKGVYRKKYQCSSAPNTYVLQDYQTIYIVFRIALPVLMRKLGMHTQSSSVSQLAPIRF